MKEKKSNVDLKRFMKEVLDKIEDNVNIQKKILKNLPESEFHLGRIQGLRTAEDIIKQKAGDKLV